MEKKMENTSGLQPVDYRVLVKPHEVKEIVKFDSGIEIVKPEITREQERLAQTYADIVAVGGSAFDEWEGTRPKVGDTVFICKYAGIMNIKGADGERYQLVNDKDITAIVTEMPEEIEFLGTRKPLGHQAEKRIWTGKS